RGGRAHPAKRAPRALSSPRPGRGSPTDARRRSSGGCALGGRPCPTFLDRPVIVRHAAVAMTFGNAVGALSVCGLLLRLASDSRSPSSRPTGLTANQEARPAPAPEKEPLARDAATPRPAEIAPQPVEPVKPSTPAPAAKPPATSSAPPPGRTAAGGLATKESPATGAEPQPRSTPPSDVVPPQPATPAAATLDLRSLEQRLRDTTAIGVFTKLSLKNQVDDLLREFR